MNEVLGRARTLCEPALRAAVGTLPPAIAEIAAYHFGWRDAEGRPVAADSGKAFRPALVFATAAAFDKHADVVLPAAVAVELVHNFSLLHDDVIDGDATRRHRATAWALFGVPAAIQVGDALLALAMGVLAASTAAPAGPSLAILSRTVGELCEGQLSDCRFETRSDVTRAECVTMATHKTGALTACACALGARLAGADDRRVSEMATFGRHLGLAFQCVDDLLGIWGLPGTTGKPVGADLRARKRSLPVVAAMTSGTQEARKLVELYTGPGELSDGAVAAATDLVAAAGGRAWTRDLADHELAAAYACLDRVGPHGTADDLHALARLVTRRDH
ncbi:MAG: polyprenyl synthetase family protein [Actinophytocola sp.]|uniref:polyprenyl synthetase family protein n=1 Tax=Actinophytocola sp. TaxID=1872138 RepID=UPI003C71AB89